MTRPTLEVADILRAQGDRFLDRYRSSFDFQQLKAFRAILRCRTAALGGHRDACLRCGYQTISYNSCRNRHCPKPVSSILHRTAELATVLRRLPRLPHWVARPRQ
jgi:Transposase zinc-binding domain